MKSYRLKVAVSGVVFVDNESDLAISEKENEIRTAVAGIPGFEQPVVEKFTLVPAEEAVKEEEFVAAESDKASAKTPAEAEDAVERSEEAVPVEDRSALGDPDEVDFRGTVPEDEADAQHPENAPDATK